VTRKYEGEGIGSKFGDNERWGFPKLKKLIEKM
jgi:hypothetical protein